MSSELLSLPMIRSQAYLLVDFRVDYEVSDVLHHVLGLLHLVIELVTQLRRSLQASLHEARQNLHAVLLRAANWCVVDHAMWC